MFTEAHRDALREAINRRHRPSQPEVLSTIHRLGRTTKPLA